MSSNPVTGADPSHNENLNTDLTTQTNQDPAAGMNKSPGGTPGGDLSATTQISSMSALRTESPKMFKAMMDGLAQSICKQMKEGQERIKKLWRQS